MKRILMLKPIHCGSADTLRGKIYEVIRDELVVIDDEEENEFYHTSTLENIEKYKDAQRWITIKDESSEDSFEYYNKDEDRYVLFNNDRELTHYLVDNLNGLAESIVNIFMLSQGEL